MTILSLFLLRLSFGLALAMGSTSPRQVTSGFFRNHLYVLLGLAALASLAALSQPDRFPLAPPLAAAVVSYLGAVCWLYERPGPGRAALWLVAGLALWGTWQIGAAGETVSPWRAGLALLDSLTSGLVLGVTLAAMFLGHWYLNTPSMHLAPLQRLLRLMAAALVARMLLCGAAAVLEWQLPGTPPANRATFLALRWLSGLVGALVLTAMTWQTLKIPNTQSATGILYVAVIATFLGELTSLLLSAQATYPL